MMAWLPLYHWMIWGEEVLAGGSIDQRIPSWEASAPFIRFIKIK